MGQRPRVPTVMALNDLLKRVAIVNKTQERINWVAGTNLR